MWKFPLVNVPFDVWTGPVSHSKRIRFIVVMNATDSCEYVLCQSNDAAIYDGWRVFCASLYLLDSSIFIEPENRSKKSINTIHTCSKPSVFSSLSAVVYVCVLAVYTTSNEYNRKFAFKPIFFFIHKIVYCIILYSVFAAWAKLFRHLFSLLCLITSFFVALSNPSFHIV